MMHLVFSEHVYSLKDLINVNNESLVTYTKTAIAKLTRHITTECNVRHIPYMVTFSDFF